MDDIETTIIKRFSAYVDKLGIYPIDDKVENPVPGKKVFKHKERNRDYCSYRRGYLQALAPVDEQKEDGVIYYVVIGRAKDPECQYSWQATCPGITVGIISRNVTLEKCLHNAIVFLKTAIDGILNRKESLPDISFLKEGNDLDSVRHLFNPDQNVQAFPVVCFTDTAPAELPVSMQKKACAGTEFICC